MNNLPSSHIAFVVITLYPRWYRGTLQSIKHTDKVRGDLALEFCRKGRAKGYKVVVVDGKSSKSFRRELLSIEGIHVSVRKGYKRAPAKRQGIKTASRLEEVKVIVATEAEKVSLLECTDEIVRPILDGDADIVIPKREESLFKSTYPSYMYGSEYEGNKLYNEQLRLSGLLLSKSDYDMFFGPRVIANIKPIVSLFLTRFRLKIGNLPISPEFLDPEQLSNVNFFPIVLAMKKKLRIASVEVPFTYPKLQMENEETGAREVFLEKRRSQRLGLLLELMHFLHKLRYR